MGSNPRLGIIILGLSIKNFFVAAAKSRLVRFAVRLVVDGNRLVRIMKRNWRDEGML